MPESEIERLSHGAGPNSFRVLAEWLRDNRQMLERRLDRQDKRLEEVNSETRQKLEEIHSETRRTNGRVTDLEKSAEMANALTEGRREWDHEREARTDRRWTRAAVLVGAASALAGGALTEVLRHIGLL